MVQISRVPYASVYFLPPPFLHLKPVWRSNADEEKKNSLKRDEISSFKRDGVTGTRFPLPPITPTKPTNKIHETMAFETLNIRH